MSHLNYEQSKQLATEDYPFYALIMAAMRRADTHNLEKLKNAFPSTWNELKGRYNAPGGVLPSDNDEDQHIILVDVT